MESLATRFGRELEAWPAKKSAGEKLWLARHSSADGGCDQCRFAGLQLSRERWAQSRTFKAARSRFSRCPLFGPLGDLAFADRGDDVDEVEQRDAEVFVRRDEVGRRRRAALS